MDLAARKRAFRDQIAAQNTHSSAALAREAGERAWEQLRSAAEFQVSERVALFASLPDEIDTRPLFDAIRQGGRSVVLPRCLPGNRLAFFPVDHFDDLRPGRYGVREPVGEGAGIHFRGGDLALIPGLAFDDAGRRLGRGGGYYDRTFEALGEDSPVRFGLAWECQRVAEVPADDRDLRVSAVLTERTFLRCAR